MLGNLNDTHMHCEIKIVEIKPSLNHCNQGKYEIIHKGVFSVKKYIKFFHSGHVAVYNHFMI